MLESKACKQCGKTFFKKDYIIKNNPYSGGAWLRRIYCSDKCRKDSGLLPKPLILNESPHNLAVIGFNNHIQGEIISLQNNQYSDNPDIIKGNIHYEVEMFNKSQKFKNKMYKRKKDKFYVLCVSIPQHIKEMFDGVYFYDESLKQPIVVSKIN